MVPAHAQLIKSTHVRKYTRLCSDAQRTWGRGYYCALTTCTCVHTVNRSMYVFAAAFLCEFTCLYEVIATKSVIHIAIIKSGIFSNIHVFPRIKFAYAHIYLSLLKFWRPYCTTSSGFSRIKNLRVHAFIYDSYIAI